MRDAASRQASPIVPYTKVFGTRFDLIPRAGRWNSTSKSIVAVVAWSHLSGRPRRGAGLGTIIRPLHQFRDDISTVARSWSDCSVMLRRFRCDERTETS